MIAPKVNDFVYFPRFVSCFIRCNLNLVLGFKDLVLVFGGDVVRLIQGGAVLHCGYRNFKCSYPLFACGQ